MSSSIPAFLPIGATQQVSQQGFYKNYHTSMPLTVKNPSFSVSPSVKTKSFSLSNKLNPINGPKVHSEAELKKVSGQFEAIFLRMVLSEMRNSIPKSTLMGNSLGLDFFQSLGDDQLASSLASQGGIGIGSSIYEKLVQTTKKS